MKPTSLVAVLVFLVACFLGSVRAQTHDKKNEIPIERCDRLPVVTMKIAGENRRFLLDTAATTTLNLKSFTSGESKQIQIIRGAEAHPPVHSMSSCRKWSWARTSCAICSSRRLT